MDPFDDEEPQLVTTDTVGALSKTGAVGTAEDLRIGDEDLIDLEDDPGTLAVTRRLNRTVCTPPQIPLQP